MGGSDAQYAASPADTRAHTPRAAARWPPPADPETNGAPPLAHVHVVAKLLRDNSAHGAPLLWHKARAGAIAIVGSAASSRTAQRWANWLRSNEW